MGVWIAPGWDTTVPMFHLYPSLLDCSQNHWDEWDPVFKPKDQNRQRQENTSASPVCYLQQSFFTVLLFGGLLPTPGECREEAHTYVEVRVRDQNPYASFLNQLGFISGKPLNCNSSPIDLSKSSILEKSVNLLALPDGLCLVSRHVFG